MKRFFIILAVFALFSCGHDSSDSGKKIITVSIAPFKYFVTEIAGDDFMVNIMVPAGANPHIYEPYPRQISRLSRSVAYISNGFLGFERAWLDRFYQINTTMSKLSVGEMIEPIASTPYHDHDSKHTEGADPHYWVSPKCAIIIASSVKDLLCYLNPEAKEDYEQNYADLILKIGEVDKKAQSLFLEDRKSVV